MMMLNILLSINYNLIYTEDNMITIRPNPNPKNSYPIKSLRQYAENLRSHEIDELNDIADELDDLFIEVEDDTQLVVGIITP